jgi:hypothetical protein
LNQFEDTIKKADMAKKEAEEVTAIMDADSMET